MPIYEYICQDCRTEFECLRPMKDADTPIPCIQCKGEQTRRQVSVFFANSGGRVVAGGNGGSCAGCSGGTCASCGH